MHALTGSREKTHEGIKEVVKPFDWSYTTSYSGSTYGPDLTPTQKPIPLHLLRRPDPILFFEEVMLYESELDDNGISVFSCKVRVMPERMLLLCRLFMRLDDVLVRVRDTRIYVEFETGEVIKEYVAREDTFGNVKKVSLIMLWMQDKPRVLLTCVVRDSESDCGEKERGRDNCCYARCQSAEPPDASCGAVSRGTYTSLENSFPSH